MVLKILLVVYGTVLNPCLVAAKKAERAAKLAQPLPEEQEEPQTKEEEHGDHH